MQRTETGPLSYTIPKSQLKWNKDLNVRPEAIQLPEENTACKLFDIGRGNHFFTFDTKCKGSKNKNQVWLHQAKCSCTAKETTNKLKMSLWNGRKYFQPHIKKGLIYRKYKKFIKQQQQIKN